MKVYGYGYRDKIIFDRLAVSSPVIDVTQVSKL